MRLFILSDLHIWGPDDPIYMSLIQLLQAQPKAGDTVVLAGDVFDFFVGDTRILCERYSSFIKCLEHLGEKGINLHYIEGNHDFHLKKVFNHIPRFTLHAEEVPLELDGKRFFVAHGDRVDKHDYKYRMLRTFFRSPVIKGFVAVAPDEWIEKIGQKSSEASRKKNPRILADLPRENMTRLRTAYRNYAVEKLMQGFDYVVMGHCHDLDEMMFKIGERPGQYINVGYPRVHGSYLVWQSGDEKISREPLPIVST